MSLFFLLIVLRSFFRSFDGFVHRLKSIANVFGETMSQRKCMLACVIGIYSMSCTNSPKTSAGLNLF